MNNNHLFLLQEMVSRDEELILVFRDECDAELAFADLSEDIRQSARICCYGNFYNAISIIL